VTLKEEEEEEEEEDLFIFNDTIESGHVTLESTCTCRVCHVTLKEEEEEEEDLFIFNDTIESTCTCRVCRDKGVELSTNKQPLSTNKQPLSANEQALSPNKQDLSLWAGVLWTWGQGVFGVLGLNHEDERHA
jgi:hypothetical protein